MNRFLVLAFSIAALTIVEAQSIFGKWKTIDPDTGNDESIVEIFEKNGKAFAKVIEIFNDADRNKTCIYCKGKYKDKLNLDDQTTIRYQSYYNWIFSSLTAIGFIGTIRGLSNALSDADIIFRSGSGLDQAISISSITGVLGVAFSTTLIALALTLLLSLAKLAIDPANELELD